MERNARETAQRAREEQAFAEIIPADLLEAVHTAGKSVRGADAVGYKAHEKVMRSKADAFIKYEESPLKSAQLYFRILGAAGYRPWKYYNQYDSVIVDHLLPRFTSDDTLATAALRLIDDQAGTLGAARWFLGSGGWKHLPEDGRERLLARLAQKSLEHPQSDARAETMIALGDMGGEWARDLLRKALHGGFHPPPYEDELKSNGGFVVLDGEWLDPYEHTDMAIAAFCLARMGDVGSRDRIIELLENAKEDLPILKKALRILDTKE